MSTNEDFPTARQTGSVIIRYGLAIIVGFAVLGIAVTAWKTLMAPLTTATGIVDRVVNPDFALQSYRWFHESYQQVQAKKSQIMLSKGALEASATDRKEARRVELLGAQQSCMSLVGEYNAKASRADTVIFKHPERFLPGNWPGDRNPLPQEINLTECN